MRADWEPYGDTYKIYRNATRRITTWLVCTVRDYGAENDSFDIPPESKSSDVTLGRFVELVNTIRASKDREIRVAGDISSLIQHVIDLRIEAQAFFDGFRSSEQKTSNDVRPNLPSILKELLETTSSTSSKDVVQVHSTFDPPDGTEHNIELSAEERVFAVYAMFKDFHEIRSYLRTIWMEYLDGTMDIMNAAVVTDTTFALLKRSWEDMSTEMDIDGYSTVINLLNGHVGLSEKSSAEFPDWICKGTLGVLQNYLKLLQVNPMPVPIAGAFGRYDPSQDRLQLPKQQQQTEDNVLLMELLPEFSYLERARIEFPAQDILTSSLKETIRCRQIEDLPVHTLFATQILLEIHHILREEADHPFKELRITAKRTLRTIDDYFRFSECKTNEGWTSEHSEMLSHFRDFVVHWTLTDQVGSIARGARYGTKPRLFYLLKNHPVLSGLLIFRLNIVMNDIGITVCNAFASLSRAAHLYRCARLSGGLEKEWEDMDFLLNLHKNTRDFSDASRCCEDRDSAISIGTTDWSDAVESYRFENFSCSERGWLSLRNASIVKNTFSGRYLEDGSLNLSYSNVDAMIISTGDAELEDVSLVNVQKALAHKLENHEQITATQLLRLITTALANENIQLRFNFFAIHRHSSTFLKTALSHIGGSPSQPYDRDLPDTGNNGVASPEHSNEAIAHLESHVKKLSAVLDVFLQVGGGGSCLAAAKQGARRQTLLESPDLRRTSLALSRKSYSSTML